MDTGALPATSRFSCLSIIALIVEHALQLPRFSLGYVTSVHFYGYTQITIGPRLTIHEHEATSPYSFSALALSLISFRYIELLTIAKRFAADYQASLQFLSLPIVLPHSINKVYQQKRNVARAVLIKRCLSKLSSLTIFSLKQSTQTNNFAPFRNNVFQLAF